MRVYNEQISTIRYKQSTRQALFFFDAKKEPKKHLGGVRIQTPNALWCFYLVVSYFHLKILYLYTLFLYTKFAMHNSCCYFKSLSKLRLMSLSLIVCLLSYSFFPRTVAISTLIFPFAKYAFRGIVVIPLSRIAIDILRIS